VLRDGDYCSYVDEDAISPLWRGARFPLEACISGWSMVNRQPAVIPDIYADPRIPHDAYRPTFVRSLVMVPIRTSDPIGAIGTYWAEHHEASEAEVRVLQSLAGATSVALENVGLLDDLRDSLNLLARQNDELQHFIRMISHDLKTPVTNIGNYVGILDGCVRRSDDVGVRRAASGIAASSDHVGRLLRDLSRFLETGRNISPTDRFSIADLVENVLVLHSSALERHGVEVVVDDRSPPWVADRARIGDVLQNLVDNAIRYRDPDRPLRIRIEADMVGDALHCGVADTGRGIDPAYLERIFEVFQRLENGGEGSGVGLSIARRIIEAHGGTIEAESDGPGRGARFCFTVPRILAPEKP